MLSKNPSGALFRQYLNMIAEAHLSQPPKITEEQRCLLKNLQYVSLLFYLAMISMLIINFWI